MTSLDPSHLPHQGTAIVRTRSGSGSFPHISTIPDLRFEQSYLKSIAPYLRTRTIATDAGEHEAVEIVSVQWGNVLWITARDQIISPLLQGTIWGLASIFIRPLFKNVGSFFGLASRPRLLSRPKGDGALKRRLREWSSGLDTNFNLS